MAIEYGVTINGFVIKTLDVIKTETNNDLKGILGNQINLLPESVFGQLRDKFSERHHELWELMQAVYNASYPQTSSGISLDNVCDFAVIERLEATESTIVKQVLFGTATTVIPAGTSFSVEDDSTTIFQTDNAVTLVAGTDEIQNIAFSATPTAGAFTLKYNTEETASLAFNASNTDVQTALNNLASLSGVTVTGSVAADFVVTFAGDDGKQEQPLLTEGVNTLSTPAATITITETTPGVYQGTTPATCTITGQKTANAKTLNVIDNPVNGLTRTFNDADAVTGRDEETDTELRLRRNYNVVTSRSATVEAIRNKILDLNGDQYSEYPQLTDVIVYENDTDIPNFYGRNIEAHAIMAVVRQAGDVTTRDQEILQAIFDSKAAGIGTSYGYATGGDIITGTVTDSTGIAHTINAARPTAIDIYLIIDNLATTSDYPSDGDTQLKTLLALYGNTLGVGIDVIVYPSLVAQIDNIPGITDFIIKIGIAPAPTLDNNIAVSDGTSTSPEFSMWSTTNITINHVP